MGGFLPGSREGYGSFNIWLIENDTLMRHLLLTKILIKKLIYLFVELIFVNITYLYTYKVGTYKIKSSRGYINCNKRQWIKSRSFGAHTSYLKKHMKTIINTVYIGVSIYCFCFCVIN